MTWNAYQFYNREFTANQLTKTYNAKITLSKAAGRDGVRHDSFQQVLENEIGIILRKVDACSYRFTPYKQRLISKGPDKVPRVLSLPTIRDRLTLRALNAILAGTFPEARSKLPHQYIAKIRDHLSTLEGNGYNFVRMDIKDFFPSINHEILLKQIAKKVRKAQIRHLIQAAIKTSHEKDTVSHTGVPQGLSISNILSSINLLGFDKCMEPCKYFRYVDDILIIAPSQDAQRLFDSAQGGLKKLGLCVHPKGISGKSQITPIEQGIDYLGYSVCARKISVRSSSFKRMFNNILSDFTAYKHVPADPPNVNRLVWRLNLKITGCVFEGKRVGWLFFFSQIDDLSQLGHLDHFVSSQLRIRGLENLTSRVARFVKCYNEIRYNFDNTKMIPNFDEKTIDQMILTLVEATGKSCEHYSTLSEAEVKTKFFKLISRYTRKTERDLIEAFS